MAAKRLVVGISGSSGAILGIRLLEMLQHSGVETHLVLTPSARLTIEQETHWSVADVQALATAAYSHKDVGAAIASGSFHTDGMVVMPCSIKTLSAIANSYAQDLLSRAADVTLKEGRPLLLAVREAPLHAGHIRLLRHAAAIGAIIFPPVPAFYARQHSLDEIVNNIAGRALARLGIENTAYLHWSGLTDPQTQKERLLADLLSLPAMTLATVGADGAPHTAAVYFVADEETRLYFFSAVDSQHGQHLRQNPKAAVSFYPAVYHWRDIQGVQMHGTVKMVPKGKAWDDAWNLYVSKFPFAAGLPEQMAQNTLYVFEPTWVKLSDNAQGFGFKEEWEIES